jgi:hypothetical protein
MGLVAVDENIPTTIQSEWVSCNIPAPALADLTLRQRPRVNLFQNFELHVYYVTVEVRGPSAQKVITT